MSLTFPFRFLSHAAGEEGGMIPLTYPPAPFLTHAAGEEGGIIPHTFPLAPLPLLHEARKGGMSRAGAISRPRSPLSRSAGEGLGVRAIRSAGEGLGVRAIRSAEAEPGVRATPSPFPHSSLVCRYYR